MTRIIPIIIVVLLLAGCASSSPPPKLYTLNSLASPGQTGSLPFKANRTVVSIGPVDIPDYLDRPQIVTRSAENELFVSEFNLWGGSLKSDVTRALIENISSLLTSEPFTIVVWRAHVPDSYRIPVYLLRFDAAPDESVYLKAKWGIVAKDGKTVVTIRESLISRPLKSREYDKIVKAMSDALEDLSKEIAAAIKGGIARNL